MPRDTSAYMINGKRVPSVTEVLRFAGMTDYSHVDPAVLENARLRGRFVAEWVEQREKGLIMPGEKVPPDQSEHQYRIDAYEDFLKTTGFKVLSNESVVFGDEGYAGTYDLYGYAPNPVKDARNRANPNGYWLLDIKASYQINKTTGPQCAAYENARRQTNAAMLRDKATGQEWIKDNITTANIGCLHLRPKSRGGGWTFKAFDYDSELLLFLSALNVVKYRLENKIVELP